jgi:hypothetical protein
MDTNRSPHRGLPAIVENQAYEFLLQLIRQYLALPRTPLSFDRINGLICEAHRRAMQQVHEEHT